MGDRAVIIINIPEIGLREDLEIPTDITVNDLIIAIGKIYGRKVENEHIFDYYLRMDNPKALMSGERKLSEYEVRDGSEIWVWNMK